MKRIAIALFVLVSACNGGALPGVVSPATNNQMTPSPITFTDFGNEKTTTFMLTKGRYIAKSTHKNSLLGNFTVYVANAKFEILSHMVANAIGNHEGEKEFSVDLEGEYRLIVNADGDWSVTITKTSD